MLCAEGLALIAGWFSSQVMQRSLLHLCCHSLSYSVVRCCAYVHRFPLVAFVLLILFASPVSAQSTPDRQWVVFRQSDGLASNSVFSVLAQDDVIWFGTASGISRYDGRWQSFDSAMSNTGTPLEIALNKVTVLATGNSEGVVWAGNEAGLLFVKGEDEVWRVAKEFGVPIRALVSSDDIVWVGTEQGLFALRNNIVTHVAEVSDASVFTLLLWDDAVWAGSAQALWRISTDVTDIEAFQPRKANGLPVAGPFTGLWGDTAGHIWISTDTTAFQYTILTGEITEDTQPFGDEAAEITDIQGVTQESVWVASSGGGAAQFRLAGNEIVSMRNWGGFAQGGLSANDIRDIATDQDGSIWFATSIGVFRYQPWAFQPIEDREYSLPVNDLHFDRKGQLWIATAGEGVQLRAERYQQATVFAPDNSGLPGGLVFDLEEDAAGRIWAITSNGVAYFDAQRWQQPSALRQLGATSIGVLKADELGVWIGSAKGLEYFEFADASVTTAPPVAGRPISALEIDALGRLWVADVEGGLWRREVDGAWSIVDGLEIDAAAHGVPVTAFYPETAPPGVMIAAFKGYGIYRTRDAGWEAIDKNRRGNSNRVFAMLANSDADAIWVGSETGLARFDRYGGVIFDAEDGLQPGAIRAITQDISGAYWFGGDRGLSYYVPEQGRPWIQLSGIDGGDVKVSDERWQVLAGEPIEVNFNYGDLQTAPEKLRVYVRLIDGAQTEAWQPITADVFHTSLPATGNYRLEYMVRDQSLNYSPIGSVELLGVPAPIFTNVPLLGKVENRIFQLLVIFAFLAVLGFGYVSLEIVQHRRRVSDAVARGYNPYISGEPVRREDMFFGRHELLQRIVSTLHNNSIMIHGERRIGKTTLLYQLANTLRQIDDLEYWFVALYIDLEGTTEDAFFHLLMEEIAQHVRSLEKVDETEQQMLDDLHFHTTLATAYNDRTFSRDLRLVIQMLEAYSTRHCGNRRVRLILLMDEMDTLSRYDHLIQQQLRRIFMREFAASVGAVVAGIEINKDWERVESPWFNLFNEIAMQPFGRNEAIQLLVEPVRGYYIFEPEAIDFILQRSDGRPHRIQQYAMEAVNEMLRHKRRRIKMHDVLTAHAIIQWDSQAGKAQTGGSALDALPLAASSPGTA